MIVEQNTKRLKIFSNSIRRQRIIEFHPQLSNDLVKAIMFLFNFLMMAPTLFSFPCSDEDRHLFKDFIKTPQILSKEVLAMNLEKSMIHSILTIWPMTFVQFIVTTKLPFEFLFPFLFFLFYQFKRLQVFLYLLWAFFQTQTHWRFLGQLIWIGI